MGLKEILHFIMETVWIIINWFNSEAPMTQLAAETPPGALDQVDEQLDSHSGQGPNDNYENHQTPNASSSVTSSEQNKEEGLSGSRRTRSRTRKDQGGSHDTKDERINSLEGELEKYYKRYKKCRGEVVAGRTAAAEKDLEIAGLSRVANEQNRKIAEFSEITTHLRDNNHGLKETIEKQRLDITELTATIAQSAHSGVTTARDDDYYEAEFTRIAGAIYQWVFRSFRGMPEVKHHSLSPAAQESLNASTIGYSALSDSPINHQEIEALVAERLCHHVFCPTFALGIHKGSYNSLYNALGGTDFQKRKWHAQTVGMIFENDGFDSGFSQRISEVEADIQYCLSIFATGGKEQQRHKALLTIVEQAAKLQLECFRQVSCFGLHRIKPGRPYDPSLMEDRSGLVRDDDRTGGAPGFIVKMVLFPPVLRRRFDEEGKFLKSPVIVRKGTVMVMRVEPETLQHAVS